MLVALKEASRKSIKESNKKSNNSNTAAECRAGESNESETIRNTNKKF